MGHYFNLVSDNPISLLTIFSTILWLVWVIFEILSIL